MSKRQSAFLGLAPVLFSQLHFLANKNTDLAIYSQ